MEVVFYPSLEIQSQVIKTTFQHADTFSHKMKMPQLHCLKLNEHNMLFHCRIHDILHSNVHHTYAVCIPQVEAICTCTTRGMCSQVVNTTSERFLCLRYAEESKRTRVFILFQVRRCLSHTPSGISNSSRPLKLLSGCLKTHRTPRRKTQSWSTKKASIRTAMEPQAPGVTTSWDLTSLLPWWWYVEQGSLVFSLRKPSFLSFFECFLCYWADKMLIKLGVWHAAVLTGPRAVYHWEGMDSSLSGREETTGTTGNEDSWPWVKFIFPNYTVCRTSRSPSHVTSVFQWHGVLWCLWQRSRQWQL